LSSDVVPIVVETGGVEGQHQIEGTVPRGANLPVEYDTPAS
jgi:hypothetical protein